MAAKRHPGPLMENANTHPCQFRSVRRHGGERRLIGLGDIHDCGPGAAKEKKREMKTKCPNVSTQIAVTECRLGKQKQSVPWRRANQRMDDLSATVSCDLAGGSAT